MSFVSQVNTFLTGTSQVTSDVESLKDSYQYLRNSIRSNTLGLITLPQVPSSLNNIFRLGNNVNNILSILGLNNTGVVGVASNTQTSSANVNSGSFKWVEMETTPDSFATADSLLLFAGDALYSNMQMGAELVPIGLCQQFSFSVGLNVIPVRELRCEENLIIPGKSQVGTINISRLCGAYSSLSNRLHILPGWNYSSQTSTFKQLFGLMAMYLTPSRQNSISTLYFERCAIQNCSVGASAGSFQLLDNVSIIFGRCLGVGELTSISSSDDSIRTSDAVQNVPEGKDDSVTINYTGPTYISETTYGL